MGVRFPSVASTAIVNVNPVTTAETIVCTTPPLILPLDFALILLVWYLTFTNGTGTTSEQIRIRRGTAITGAAIQAAPYTVFFGASAGGVGAGCYIDTPGAVTGQQYSLTYQAVAATGNATITDCCLMAFAL